MAGTVPSPCRIFRIIHVDNLPGILEQGGMWCANEMAARDLPYLQIGLQDLTKQRGCREVPAGPGGNLNDYVPFYFCPRSIMLYQIHTGRVPTYAGGQESIVTLVTTVEKICESGHRFAFSDRHAKTTIARFFSDPADLGELDWEVIGSDSFVAAEQPDRPERKQAEFLVLRFVPWEDVLGIGVYSQRFKERCDAVLVRHSRTTKTSVIPKWYFSK